MYRLEVEVVVYDQETGKHVAVAVGNVEMSSVQGLLKGGPIIAQQVAGEALGTALSYAMFVKEEEE